IEFPNLDPSEGTFLLNKMFIKDENINPQTVTINYSTNGADFIQEEMEFDGNLKYSFKFPYLFNDELVDFYFTYLNNNDTTFINPQNGSYRFYYGSLDISLNTELEKTFTDYVVSEPYPNPFNPAQSTFTSISIKSMGNENLIIRIIDPLGQQVGYYNSITVDDENRFDWYGTNERGVPLAIGVYYFLIDLNGKQYSRNLVLLR
ncbi:MAG: Subtilisin-like serine protease, partial [Ignavibacteriaceae bacterium]|nr:Subtilisin-like serine protease [Ignavibacteriaceae bacterium]